jgi:hypothetical protein
MPIAEIKWWQWTLISMLLGTALAYMHLNPFDATNITTMGMVRIERLINAGQVTLGGQKFAPIINVVVYPAIDLPTKSPTSDTPKVVQVKLFVLDATRGEYDPRVCNTDVPYYPHLPLSATTALANETPDTMAARYYGVKSVPRPVMQAIYDANTAIERNPHGAMRAGQRCLMPPKWTPTVLEYLREQGEAIQKAGGGVAADWLTPQVKYAWWAEPKTVWTMWMGGSVLVLGVIWPLALQLLIKGGFAPPPREKLMDMSRYGKGTTEKAAAAMPVAAMTISPEEQERLDALEAKIMADLKEQAAKTPAPPPPEPVEIKKLGTEAVAPVAVQDHEIKTSKDYRGGVFYPVATPPADAATHKKPDAHPSDATHKNDLGPKKDA